MSPSLTRTGIVLLAVSAALVVTGAVAPAWPLLALGFLQLSAVLVLYVLFIPQAVLLRRRQLEFAWWVPVAGSAGGALAAGRPLALHMLLRNFSPYRIGALSVQVLASQAIQLEDEQRLEVAIPPRNEVRLQLAATPLRAGYWYFHGLHARIRDRFGVFMLQLYFPNLLGIKVFPALAAGRQPVPYRPRTGASHERTGPRLLRQRGLGSDLRELRDHTPGDPFKRIAWKATARTRKLMVREYESEIVVTHWVLLDISPTMREGPRPGATKLDYALSLGAGLARQALRDGDRVGLLSFDTRLYSRVQPRDGQPQLYRIIDRLMELHCIVDEDLTDLTDAELHSAVADYLAYQQGVDVRVRQPPPRGSPQWNDLVNGASGELIDFDVMRRAVRATLDKGLAPGAPSWWSRVIASSAAAIELRRFCRMRGLEIPYRRASVLSSKQAGITQALARAGAARTAQFILLLSDLEEIDDHAALLDALRLARRRGHRIAVIAPYAPDFIETGQDGEQQRIHNIVALRHQRQRAAVRLAIEQLGISVLSAAPTDGINRILDKLHRLRRAS